MVSLDRKAKKLANSIPLPWRSHASGATFDSGSQTLTVKMSDSDDFTVDLSGAGPPSAGGGVNPGTQYYAAYYATSTNAISELPQLRTDGSNNIILSGASNIAKTGVDFQNTLGVSGTLTVSGAASLLTTLEVSGTSTFKDTLILDNNTSAYKVTIDTSNDTGENYTLTLPTTKGTANYALVTDGNGVLSWASNSDANYYATGGSLASGDITISGDGGFTEFDIDVSALATGSIGSSTQYYNAFYNTATGVVGSNLLQTDASSNILLSGVSNIAKTAADFQSTLGVSGALTVSGATTLETTLTATGATTLKNTLDAQSTVGVSGALNVSGATMMLGGGTASGNLYVKTGSRNQLHADIDLGAATLIFRDSGATADDTQYKYYPRLSLEQDSTDPGTGHAAYPSIYFLKYGPSGAGAPAGGNPVGWRQVSSGAAGVAVAPQHMVWEYTDDNTDPAGSVWGPLLSLSNQGVLKINDIYTLPTDAGTDGHVMTSDGAGGAAWEAASGGGGTIGGSITDNQVAFGATTADSIEGSANLTWDGANFNITGSSPKIIVDGGGSDDASIELRESASYGGRMYYDGDSGVFMKFTTIDGGTEKIRMAYDRDGSMYLGSADANDATTNPNMFIDQDGGKVGIGTTAPGELLHVAGTARITGKTAIGSTTAPTLDGVSISNTIQVAEKSSISGPAGAGWGTFWVSGSTPNVPMFTDDAGTTIQLGAGGTFGGSLSDNYIAIGTAADTIGNFVEALTENNSIWIGDDPSSTTSTAEYNTSVGITALDAITTGDYNTTVGYAAGGALTDSAGNAFFGTYAGEVFNHVDGHNTLLGYGAGRARTGGSQAVAIGSSAGRNAGAANSDVMIGYQAGYYVTGSNNVMVGAQAGQGPSASAVTSSVYIGKEAGFGTEAGEGSVLIGRKAGYYPTGNYNTFIGYIAGSGNSTTRTAWGNVGIGKEAFKSVTSANRNVAIGESAGGGTTSATYNVLVGSHAGNALTTQGNNVVVGTFAGQNTTSADSVYLGYNSGYNLTANKNVMVGRNAGTSNASTNTAENSVGIGYYALNAIQDGHYNVAIGSEALRDGTSAASNVAIGEAALFDNITGNRNVAIGRKTLYTSTGNDVTALGHEAGYAITDGTQNTIIGVSGARAMTNGNYNTVIGHNAAANATSMGSSVIIGREASAGSTNTGDDNIFIGVTAGYGNTDADKNVGIGRGALYSNLDGDQNVGIGYKALSGSTASNNIGIGHEAGDAVTTGQGNTIVGSKAGQSFDTESYVTVIGSEAFKDAVGDQYAIAIGYRALANSDATGGQNIAMGQSAGRYFGSATSDSVVIGGSAGAGSSTTDFGGSSVVAVGGNALQDLVSGSYTIGIGRNAFSNTLSGQASIAIGGNAGQNAFNLQDCIFIGTSAGKGAGGGASAGIKSNYDIAIGYQAGMRFGSGATATYSNVAIGPDAMGQTVTGNYNVAIGHGAASGATDVGDQNVAIGYLAGKVSTGNYNVFVGASAGLAATSTTLSTIVGKEAGQGVMTGEGNSLFGYRAGYSLTSAHDNTIIGKSAGQNATTSMRDSVIVGFKALLGYTTNSSHGRFTVIGGEAGYNVASTSSDKNNYTAIGFQAGYNDKSDSSHQLFGSSAGYNLSGTSSDGSTFVGNSAGRGKSTGYIAIDSVGVGRSVLSDEAKYTYGDIFIGSRAGANFVSGTANVAIGFDAMRYGGQATLGAVDNIAIGRYSGYNLGRHAAATGSIAIGHEAGYYVSGGSKNVYIGYKAGPSSETATESNQLYIHNTNGTPLIGGDFSTKEVNISGSVELINGAITSNPGANHLWASGATLFWGGSQLGTTTPGAGAIEGTATAGEVSYGDGSNSITSSSNFLFDGDNLKLIDSKKAIFGTGNDFQIYHNGSNSYLENNTGDILFRNLANDADMKFKITDNTTETEVIRIVGATSRVGIGTTSPDFKLDVRHAGYNVAQVSGAGNGNYPILHVKDSADQWPAWFEGNRSGDPGAGIRLWHNPSSPNENNNTYVHFCMNNDADERVTYANIKGTIDDYTDGTEDGKVKIFVMADGSETESVNFSKNGIIIDEYTRIMRNTSTNGLYLTDSGGNPVKLSTASGTNGGISFDNTTSNTIYRDSGVSMWDSTESYRLQGNTTTGYLQLDLNKISLVRNASSAASSMFQFGDGGTYDQFSILEDQRGSTATNGLLFLRAKKTGDYGYATLGLKAISGSNYSEMYVNGISTNEAFRFDTNSKSHAFDIAKAGYVSVGGAVDSTNQFTVVGTTHLSGAATVTGVLSATAKSFNIEHPLYKDKRLVHGSLEGPEHGIYIRGTIEAKEYGCEIELPEYWEAMCDDYTVQLTPHGPYTVYINEKQKDKVMVASTSREYKFDYYIVGSRTDETLEVVQDA